MEPYDGEGATMSGHWEHLGRDGDSPVSSEELPAPPGQEQSLSSTVPDVPPPPPPAAGPAIAGKPPRATLKRVIAAGLALAVVAALAAGVAINSQAGGVKAAFASVFSSRSLRVVFSAHSANLREQHLVGQYSVVLMMTSENGGAPLSASAGRQAYEISVLRGGVDLGDIVIHRNVLYGRINLRAIEPRAYMSGTRALVDLPPGAGRDILSAVLHDHWVGIREATITSFGRSFDRNLPRSIPTGKLDNLRNAFSLSFAQAWDAWTSSRQLSSENGVTRYSVRLPVRQFVSAFVKDIRGALERNLPSQYLAIASKELTSAPAAIDRIPAGLEIPMALSVTNGSLTKLIIVHKSDSVDLSISHPTLGVTAPRGATMITSSTIRSLFGTYLRSGTPS